MNTIEHLKPANNKGIIIRQIRVIHTYLGLIVAPTLIFLAFTGLLQVYGLHQAHGAYEPPAWVERLARLHKDQRLALRKPDKPKAAAAHAAPEGPSRTIEGPRPGATQTGSKLATGLLKAFFALVSVGLISSTATGVWMALRPPRTRKTYAAVIVVGAALPPLLAVFTF